LALLRVTSAVYFVSISLFTCRSLGWTEIPAHVVSLSEIDEQLAEIDENLIRNDLTVLERGEQLARRKGLYEAKHPQVKHGGDRKSKKAENQDADSAPRSFKDDTAAKTKQSARTIAEDVQIANNIPEPIRDAQETREQLQILQLFVLIPSSKFWVFTGLR